MFTDRALAEVRKRGWAQSAAERESGVASSLGAGARRPGRGDRRDASVSGPIDRMGRGPNAYGHLKSAIVPGPRQA